MGWASRCCRITFVDVFAKKFTSVHGRGSAQLGARGAFTLVRARLVDAQRSAARSWVSAALVDVKATSLSASFGFAFECIRKSILAPAQDVTAAGAFRANSVLRARVERNILACVLHCCRWPAIRQAVSAQGWWAGACEHSNRRLQIHARCAFAVAKPGNLALVDFGTACRAITHLAVTAAPISALAGTFWLPATGPQQEWQSTHSRRPL